MGFFKDLINGHEAFFLSDQTEKEKLIRTKKAEVSVLVDSSKEEVKAA